jgi:hypothetical protein
MLPDSSLRLLRQALLSSAQFGRWHLLRPFPDQLRSGRVCTQLLNYPPNKPFGPSEGVSYSPPREGLRTALSSGTIASSSSPQDSVREIERCRPKISATNNGVSPPRSPQNRPTDRAGGAEAANPRPPPALYRTRGPSLPPSAEAHNHKPRDPGADDQIAPAMARASSASAVLPRASRAAALLFQ